MLFKISKICILKIYVFVGCFAYRLNIIFHIYFAIFFPNEVGVSKTEKKYCLLLLVFMKDFTVHCD